VERALTPKEQRTFASIGRRHFKNRERRKMIPAGPNMVIPQDQIFAEIGKLHLQVTQQANNLQNMARAITERDRRIADLEKQIAALKSPAQPGVAGPSIMPNPAVRLTPEEVAELSAELDDASVPEEEKEKIRAALQGKLASDVSEAQAALDTKTPA
jgi:hypothetical protein